MSKSLSQHQNHWVAADMLPDYLDEHDGEPPHEAEEREQDPLRYGCAGVADIDKLIRSVYGKI